MIKEKIKKEILKLSKEERAELAHLLIDSIDVEEPFDTEEAWSAELKRRVDRFERGESHLISWEEVRKNVRSIIEK